MEKPGLFLNAGDARGGNNQRVPLGPEEGNKEMIELFVNAFVTVRGLHGSLLQRARVERGASMVEYALLVGLIAIVAVVAVMALGNGISSLFGSANSCVGGINSGAATNC
jgi:pilus assembly protein Flp/PilA